MIRFCLLALLLSSSSIQAMDVFDDRDHKTTPRTYAVIGDFGANTDGAQKVFELIKKWNPDCIYTTGDNNYHWTTNPKYVGDHYKQYVNSDPEKNRLWPCAGNHDFVAKGDASPYLNYYFALKNQLYYGVTEEPCHFISLCSEKRKYGNITPDSEQMSWLKDTVSTSKAPWKICLYHHPTYSSRTRSPGGGEWPPEIIEKNGERTIDPPFKDWGGVSLVLNGHLHHYERFDIEGVPYITNGLGGDSSFYTFCDDEPDPRSVKRFEGMHGALFIKADDKMLRGQFVTVSDEIVDEFILDRE